MRVCVRACVWLCSVGPWNNAYTSVCFKLSVCEELV